MPRGVLIPEVRQQFFAALERLIAAEGLSGLTGRAVTREAGVATGLLHTHFRTWENFLVGYATDRSFQIAAAVAPLAGQVGAATVAANVAGALSAGPPEAVPPLTRLLACRPDLVRAVEEVLGPGSAGLGAVELALARYLAAERGIGRLPAGADAEAMALALVGARQRLVLAGEPTGSLSRIVGSVLSGGSTVG